MTKSTARVLSIAEKVNPAAVKLLLNGTGSVLPHATIIALNRQLEKAWPIVRSEDPGEAVCLAL